MKKRLVMGVAGVFVLLLGIAPVLADQSFLKIGPEVVAPLKPAQKFLSGRPGLIIQGIDPLLSLDRKEALKAQGDVLAQAPGPGGAALVPYRDPSAKFSRNVLISEDFSGLPFQTEPHLAVDPKDPDHIIVGLIDYNFPSLTSYVTIDGGATWEGPSQVRFPREDLASAGDPVVGFDRAGVAYYALISLDVDEFTIGPLVGAAVVSRISVARSEDGGFTWQEPVAAAQSRFGSQVTSAIGEKIRGILDFGFLDKPWMAIGPHPQDPQRDVIYVTYTNFITSWEVFWIDELPFLGAPTLETIIELVRSEDGGVTWSDPIEVSPRVRYVAGGQVILSAEAQPSVGVQRIVQGSRPVVAPDGTVYVAWMDTTDDRPFEGLAEIYVARSEDGGKNFSQSSRAAFFLETGFRPQNAFFRYWGTVFPRIAVGPDEEIYVVYTGIPANNPDDDGDTFMVRSTDKGRSWSRPVRLNDDETDRLQFFPEVDVGGDGVVHVMWGDMRDDSFETSYHIYYTKSEDGGETWAPNSRVTDFPSNPNRGFPRGLFIGDYFSIKAVEEDVYMAWADTRLGEFGPSNQKIAFARQKLMPTPSIFLSPPSGPGGKDIVIQGFNFQPNRNLFIEVDGVIISTGRVQPEGRFANRIFIPISGEGPHDVRVIDASGNVASSSFFMDFGFDTIQKLGQGLVGASPPREGATSPLTVPVAPTGGNPGLEMAEVEKAIERAVQEALVGLETPAAEEESGSALWLLVGLAAGVIPLIALGVVGAMLVRRARGTS